MRYLVLLLSVLLAGCATLVSVKDVPVEVRTQTYEASKEEVMGAIRSAFTAKAFGIEDVDEEAGLVRSGWKQSSNIVGSKARSRYSASVTALDSTETRVRLTMTAQRQSLNGWRAASVPKDRARELHTNAFETISEKLD